MSKKAVFCTFVSFDVSCFDRTVLGIPVALKLALMYCRDGFLVAFWVLQLEHLSCYT